MHLKILFLALSLCFTLNAQASGGGGGGGYGGGGFSTGTVAPQRQTDPVYEHGKAIYKGRVSSYKDISVCILSETDEAGFSKVKSKTIKHLKSTSYNEVAKNLVTCDDKDQLVFNLLSRNDTIALIYYLDKRYKLKLKS